MSFSVIKEAETHLVQLLHTEARSLRAEYLDRCVGNLKRSEVTPQTLHLMMRILSVYLQSKKKKVALNGILETMEQKHQLLTLYFTDLVFYRGLAGEKRVKA